MGLGNLFPFVTEEQSNKKWKEEKRFIVLGEEYSLVVLFMPRNNITLSLDNKGELITLKMPNNFNMEDAESFVLKKRIWIRNKVRALRERNANTKVLTYTDGETHMLLGEEFTLRVEVTNKRLKPVFADGELRVFVKDASDARIAVLKWYAENAPLLFSKVITPVTAAFMMRYNMTYSAIEYKYVTSYWGQCTKLQLIRLNIELLRAPVECVEYIMAHELCHLKHKNHSARFYAQLTEFMPDWKQRKELLNKSITILR